MADFHRILTEGTLEDQGAAGRLQTPEEERVAVFYRDDEESPIHRPPPAELLPRRLQQLCDFANEGGEEGPFVPPVARAILVHFWLAYDHPLPISWLLREAPARYTRAFLETETDDGDTTYFLLHQLGVIEQAIEDLETARADLGGLAERRLLVRRRRGRSYIFEPTPDLLARLKESGA